MHVYSVLVLLACRPTVGSPNIPSNTEQVKLYHLAPRNLVPYVFTA